VWSCLAEDDAEDAGDGYSIDSRTSILSRPRKFECRPSAERKDDTDIDKMKVCVVFLQLFLLIS